MNKNLSKILCHLILMSDTRFFFFFLVGLCYLGVGVGRGLDIRLSFKLIKQFALVHFFVLHCTSYFLFSYVLFFQNG